jgi:hypothetical protein
MGLQSGGCSLVAVGSYEGGAVLEALLDGGGAAVVSGLLGGGDGGDSHTADSISRGSGLASLALILGARVPVSRPHGTI